MNPPDIVKRWQAGVVLLRRASGARPQPTRQAQLFDAALSVAVAVFTVVYALVHRDSDQSGQPPLPLWDRGVPPQTSPVDVGWTLFLLLLGALPLAARRRYPLTVLWTVMIATIGLKRSGGMEPYLLAPVLIAAYSVAVYSQYRPAALVSLVTAVAFEDVTFRSVIPTIAVPSTVLLFTVPVVVAGNAIRTWRSRLDREQARLRVMEHERESATRRAVELERSRIARELHDVVTHNVSVMVVQAGAARKVLPSAPEQARQALLAVEASGRAALTELRQVMGLLAPAADDEELTPLPGIDQVHWLVGRVADAGLPVTLSVTGSSRPVPRGIGLAAYRVVQEALTNVVKHAKGASAHVAVMYEPGALRVDVLDTGGTPGESAATGDGHGLLGLRERLAVYDGSLRAGRLPGGGFQVQAVIPLAEPGREQKTERV